MTVLELIKKLLDMPMDAEVGAILPNGNYEIQSTTDGIKKWNDGCVDIVCKHWGMVDRKEE